MPRIRELQVVDKEFFNTATTLVTIHKNLPCGADTLFRLLADAPTWAQWLGATRVDYTCDPPHGVGSTRRVTISRQIIDERFLIWEPGRRMSFFVERSTFPMRAFAEDFQITPVSESECVLTWVTAIEARPKILSSSLGVAIRANGNRALDKLVDFVATHADDYPDPV